MTLMQAIELYNAGLISTKELEDTVTFHNMGSDSSFYTVTYTTGIAKLIK